MSKYNDSEEKKARLGKTKTIDVIEAKVLNSIIGWVIVVFNKFLIGKAIHKITHGEKITNNTDFNISFGVKLSICLFLNTAVISFIIDILLFKNIIG